MALLACTTLRQERPAPAGPEPYLSDVARRVALGEAEPAWVYDFDAFEIKRVPEPGDWLEAHPEPGQTVEAFLGSSRPTVDGPLVLVPIAIDDDVAPWAEVLSAWLGVPVEVRPIEVDVAGLPGRIHPDTQEPQLYTPRLLQLLKEARPDDAFGVLGVTAVDLAPSEDWNFVFGQATYDERVGVFSTARQRPEGTPELQARRRAVHTLGHEALHMLGVHHCPYFACAMNGSNSLAESDATPLHLCPICLRKLVLATGVDPVERYERLEAAYRAAGLTREADWIAGRLDR